MRQTKLQPPGLDVGLLAFPSDGLSLAAVRRHCPAYVPGEVTAYPDGDLDAALSRLLRLERAVARRAYAEAAGLPPAQDGFGTAVEILSVLAHEYRLFGIAPGIVATRQLVRRIESAAAEQVREHSRP